MLGAAGSCALLLGLIFAPMVFTKGGTQVPASKQGSNEWLARRLAVWAALAKAVRR